MRLRVCNLDRTFRINIGILEQTEKELELEVTCDSAIDCGFRNLSVFDELQQ